MKRVTGILCGILLCAVAGCLIEEKAEVDLAEKAAEIESARASALVKREGGDFAGVVSTCKRGLGAVRTFRRNARHDDELWAFVAHRAYVLEQLKAEAEKKAGPAEPLAPATAPTVDGTPVAGAGGEGEPAAGTAGEGTPGAGEGEPAAGTGGETQEPPDEGTPAVEPPETEPDATPPAGGGTGEPAREHVPDGI